MNFKWLRYYMGSYWMAISLRTWMVEFYIHPCPLTKRTLPWCSNLFHKGWFQWVEIITEECQQGFFPRQNAEKGVSAHHASAKPGRSTKKGKCDAIGHAKNARTLQLSPVEPWTGRTRKDIEQPRKNELFTTCNHVMLPGSNRPQFMLTRLPGLTNLLW